MLNTSRRFPWVPPRRWENQRVLFSEATKPTPPSLNERMYDNYLVVSPLNNQVIHLQTRPPLVGVAGAVPLSTNQDWREFKVRRIMRCASWVSWLWLGLALTSAGGRGYIFSEGDASALLYFLYLPKPRFPATWPRNKIIGELNQVIVANERLPWGPTNGVEHSYARGPHYQ